MHRAARAQPLRVGFFLPPSGFFDELRPVRQMLLLTELSPAPARVLGFFVVVVVVVVLA